MLRDSYVKPLSIVSVMMAHASFTTSKPKVELDSHTDTCVVGDNCLAIHDHNRPVNVYSKNPKDGHRSAKTIDATVGYQDLQNEKNFILIIKKAIHFDGLKSHLLCPMQCHLNGVHISKVPKFLTESPIVATPAKVITEPFDATHPLIILLQLRSITSYFDVYSSSIAKYENDEI